MTYGREYSKDEAEVIKDYLEAEKIYHGTADELHEHFMPLIKDAPTIFELAVIMDRIPPSVTKVVAADAMRQMEKKNGHS